MNQKYDYLIVGAGLFGAVFAREATDIGKKVLVIDKRNHVGGNCHTKIVDDIPVHVYGPHCFHCSQKYIWDYVNRFAEFNNFTLRTKAHYKDKLYSLPINLYTMHQVWGVNTPSEAIAKIESERIVIDNPANLEEHILSMVGTTMYEMFIKGYTTKQWGCDPKELPASIIKRLPIRFTMNDRYFHDAHKWEGIPIGGYTQMISNMLDGIEVKLNVDYLANRQELDALAHKVVYSGPIDSFYDYRFGKLDYRSLNFKEEQHDGDYQGNAIINYTDHEVPWTRIVEHKHFEFIDSPTTIITKEYPALYTGLNDPYYPINDHKNNQLYEQYRVLSEQESHVIFGGRLASYRYFDMDMTIANALSLSKKELKVQ